jgi:hypothetical protein
VQQVPPGMPGMAVRHPAAPAARTLAAAVARPGAVCLRADEMLQPCEPLSAVVGMTVYVNQLQVAFGDPSLASGATDSDDEGGDQAETAANAMPPNRAVRDLRPHCCGNGSYR